MGNLNEIMARIKQFPDMDTDYAVEMIGGSESLYIKLLQKVIGLLPANISAMDGKLNEEDALSAFGGAAHGMKSSLNQVGCFHMAGLAEKLEKAAKQGDRDFCTEHYAEFRAEALRFHEQAAAALQEGEAGPEHTKRQIGDFAEVLLQAKTEAEGFESLLAAKSLTPLTQYIFGGKLDLLLLKALEELELFRPRKAIPYLTELLDECEK